ncbi:hypothetical protein [Methanothermococcus okinawensis]|uniref:Uncharacterized protein n=1 Tax=Methanothermococcus okinawensis (strain DSM 14208 / JCM 11175 / IH1) TaxID=647113 RepID=F8AL59_METOI|nr:hypothetical protein [Methanothermococcus okinawensis]AEH06422.1 hypothetical protein Metok_0438 [Methanothermococcus okinawensis IH1]
MNRNGLLFGIFLWIIIVVFLYMGFAIFPNKAYNYVCYSLTTISISTCCIIGLYLTNKDNLVIQKFLKIDIFWLFIGILLMIFEIILNKYHSYDMYLPLIIYFGRLISIYVDNDLSIINPK